jgi:hypothetical protein
MDHNTACYTKVCLNLLSLVLRSDPEPGQNPE